jgi:cytochrome P450
MWGAFSVREDLLTIFLRTRGTPIAAAWIKSPCQVLFEMAHHAPGQNIDMELGGKVFHIVQHAAALHHVLRDNLDNYPKYFAKYRGFFGESRLTTHGEVWRRLRDRSQPFITAVPPEKVMAVAHGYFAEAVETLLAQAQPGGEANVDTEVDFAAARTVGDTVLGFPFEAWGRQGLEEMRLILRFASTMNFPILGSDAGEHEARRAEAKAALQRLGERFLRAVTTAEAGSAGLLGLIQQGDNDDVDLFGEMATHLFAGFDTTAAAISWSLYLLALNPDLQERLRAMVLALPDGAEVRNAALADLAPLRAFVQEAIRIFPPIPVLSRLVLADDAIDGWQIARGNTMILSMIGLHHDRNIYPNPARIDLGRHPDGHTPRALAPHFLPFGDGQRICPGSRFANAELLSALAAFLRRARIHPGGASTIAFRWDATLRRDHGNHLRLESL